MVLEVLDIKLLLRIRELTASINFINIIVSYGIIPPDLKLGERNV